MRFSTKTPADRRRRRGGFTLLELLAVVAIIAILASLLLVAISGAKKNVKVAEVRQEISALTNAIAQFKATYGIEPPSHLTLYEKPTDITKYAGVVPEAARTLAILRRIWPRIDFTQLAQVDLDNDGTPGEPDTAVILTGAECLVYFLGGIKDSSGTTVTGFSKNPSNPFSGPQTGELREGPFFEFKTSRLMASPSTRAFFVYRDPTGDQSAPYAYANSYEGTGYFSAMFPLQTRSPFDTTQTIIISDIQVMTADAKTLNPFNTNFVPQQAVAYQDLLDVYRVSSTSPSPGHNPKSFQIISAGPDFHFGTGGFYDANRSEGGLTPDTRAATVSTAKPSADNDNVTNFAGGRLVP